MVLFFFRFLIQSSVSETKYKKLTWEQFHNSKEPNRNVLYGAVIGGPDEPKGSVTLQNRR